MSDEDLPHRIWGWIGREFGAPLPDPDNPNELVPLLESEPTERVQVLAAKLDANHVAAFVSKCGPLGQVIMPWPNDILGSNLVPPYALNRSRANLYVVRRQLAEAQALITEESAATPTSGAPERSSSRRQAP